VRYIKPYQTSRPARSDRFDVFSPKLGRPLILFSYLQLQQWLLLEAFPSVKAFCERPDLLEVQDGKTVLVDFWIQSASNEFFLVIRADDSPKPNLANPAAVRTRYLKSSHLRSWSTLAKNWQSMLPYVVAYRHWLTSEDTVDIIKRCSSPLTLGELENSFSSKESSWVRACVFDALGKGLLRAPSLKTKQWNQFLQLSPVHQYAD
jgi:hypothetical protein